MSMSMAMMMNPFQTITDVLTLSDLIVANGFTVNEYFRSDPGWTFDYFDEYRTAQKVYPSIIPGTSVIMNCVGLFGGPSAGYEYVQFVGNSGDILIISFTGTIFAPGSTYSVYSNLGLSQSFTANSAPEIPTFTLLNQNTVRVTQLGTDYDYTLSGNISLNILTVHGQGYVNGDPYGIGSVSINLEHT